MKAASYSATAGTLAGRIVDLIPGNPRILEMDSPWDLFKVEGFKCDDIGPSLSQASWSLAQAKQVYCRSKESTATSAITQLLKAEILKWVDSGEEDQVILEQVRTLCQF